MNEFIKEEFRFLVDQHSFTQVLQGALMSYESTDLVVRPSCNERDGFSTGIVVPARGSQEIAVGTILAALESDGPRNVASWIDAMRRVASFLKAHLERLLNMPADVYDDCCALRFWHGPLGVVLGAAPS
jgi:hypothetical protein